MNPRKSKNLFKAYRVPGFHQDEISLALDLDAFKGFGIWIDEKSANILDACGLQEPLRNFHPRWTSARSRPGSAANSSTFTLGSMRTTSSRGLRDAVSQWYNQPARPSRITSIVDLLRRSQKAADENSIYYVSLLATIVRSSYFKEISKLERDTDATPDSPSLAAGWAEASADLPDIAGGPRREADLQADAGLRAGPWGAYRPVFTPRKPQATRVAASHRPRRKPKLKNCRPR